MQTLELIATIQQLPVDEQVKVEQATTASIARHTYQLPEHERNHRLASAAERIASIYSDPEHTWILRTDDTMYLYDALA